MRNKRLSMALKVLDGFPKAKEEVIYLTWFLVRRKWMMIPFLKILLIVIVSLTITRMLGKNDVQVLITNTLGLGKAAVTTQRRKKKPIAPAAPLYCPCTWHCLIAIRLFLHLS